MPPPQCLISLRVRDKSDFGVAVLAEKRPVVQQDASPEGSAAKDAWRLRVFGRALVVCLVALEKLVKAHPPEKALRVEFRVPNLGGQLRRLTPRITCRRKRAKPAVAGQVHADVMRLMD